MEQIINNLTQLKGVYEASIYQEEGDFHTSLDDTQSEQMKSTSQTIEQIFMALRAVNKTHNEIYFSIGNRYLIAYFLESNAIISLLTAQKINLPLIHMGVKTAAKKLTTKTAPPPTPQPPAIVNIPSASPAPDVIPPLAKTLPPATQPLVSFEIDAYIAPLSDSLIEYLGPAAPFVVEDAVGAWKNKFIQNHDNLPELVSLIVQELDSTSEKESYQQQAYQLLNIS